MGCRLAGLHTGCRSGAVRGRGGHPPGEAGVGRLKPKVDEKVALLEGTLPTASGQRCAEKHLSLPGPPSQGLCPHAGHITGTSPRTPCVGREHSRAARS